MCDHSCGCTSCKPKPPKFWMLAWCGSGGTPATTLTATVARFTSLELAQKEAEKQLIANPGREMFVCEAIQLVRPVKPVFEINTL